MWSSCPVSKASVQYQSVFDQSRSAIVPSVELRQLRYFVGVAERESFTRASEDLLIAQPALSAQIAKLEDELGVALFERIGRRVRLTDTGRLVLSQAKRALAASDDVERIARLGAQGVLGHLTLGYTRVFPFRLLTAILRSYRRRRPQVALDLREVPSEEQIAVVRNGELDCGFVRVNADIQLGDELEVISMPVQPVVAVLSANHPLAKRRTIRLRDLADEDWVVMGRRAGETIYDDIIAACRRAGFMPRVVQEVNDVRIVLGFVAAGLGIALLSGAARDLRVRGVHFVPISPRTELRFAAIARADGRSAALAALLADLRVFSA